MTCSVGMALFLVLFALVTFIFELFALYLLHSLITRRDGRDLRAVDMALMFLSMVLIALNGFAAVCPCFDADGISDYAELTSFWLPLFYGLFTVLSKLITFDVFRAISVASPNSHEILSEHSVTVFQSLIAVTLCVVLITTLCLGAMTAPTLSVLIVALSVLHCASLSIFISSLNSAAQKSQSSPNSKSKSSRAKHSVDDVEREDESVQSDAEELLKLSRVLRSAVTSALSFAVLIVFAIWLSAIWNSAPSPSSSAVALLFFVSCSLGVFADMLCAALLRSDLASAKELFRDANSSNSKVRWVPQSARLLSASSEDRESDEQCTPATFEDAGDGDGALAEFGLTNSKKDIIIRYSKDGDGDADGADCELDKYTKPTLADPTSYTEVEKELDDLMEMELNKKSANSEEL